MVKRLGILVFIVVSIGLMLYGSGIPTQKVVEVAQQIKSSPYKLPIFIVWSLLVCFINVPLGAITKLFSGWLFGFLPGFLTAYFTTLLGAFMAFRFARFLGKDFIERRFYKSMLKVNQKLSQGELSSLIQIRIFPFIPLPVANLCLGVTSVSNLNFLISSLIGILPATLFYTYLGSRVITFSSQTMDFNSFLPYYLYILGALIVSYLIPILFRKFKKKEPPVT